VKEKNPDGAKQLKAGDVITGVDGQAGLVTESDLLGYLFQKKAPGSTATLSILRGGKVEKVTLAIP
jgi:S1-C subfamily serine protease